LETNPESSAPREDPSLWLQRYGDRLYAYARARLGDEPAAEDAVQEALLAAWKARDSFRGDSSVATWLTAILRRCVIDLLRKRGARSSEELQPDPTRSMFTRGGHWPRKPAPWPDDPQACLDSQEFWACLRLCLSRLPRGLMETFLLREIDQLEADEVCKLLGISPSNLWTRLHRARMLLRGCLGEHGFDATGELRT
jgi:RNA polymerase sigma-70 factor (ECF subfamily)